MRQYDIVVRLLFMYRMRVKGCACMGHDLAAARVKSWQWIIGRRMPRPHVLRAPGLDSDTSFTHLCTCCLCSNKIMMNELYVAWWAGVGMLSAVISATTHGPF